MDELYKLYEINKNNIFNIMRHKYFSVRKTKAEKIIGNYKIEFDKKELIITNTANDTKNIFKDEVSIIKNNSLTRNSTIEAEKAVFEYILGENSQCKNFTYNKLDFDNNTYTSENFKNNNENNKDNILVNFTRIDNELQYNNKNENFEHLVPPEPLIEIGYIDNEDNRKKQYLIRIEEFIEIFVKPPTTPEKKGGKRRSQKIKRKRRRTIKKHKKTKSKK